MSETTKERQVKCPMCKASFAKSATIEHGKRYYCQPCYAIKSQPKARTDWDDLYDTIKHYYGSVTPVMFRQLKQYREETGYKFTDSGMRLTLIYYHEILGRPVLDGTQTLGIIPYVYEDAKRYYSEVYRLSQLAQNQTYHDKRQVQTTNTQTRKKPVKWFDFNLIEWGMTNESEDIDG